MPGFRFRLNWLSCTAYYPVIHHMMNMPDLPHLVIIVASDVCLVFRFFADRTVELMRATTSSPAVFPDRCFPGEHSPLCYLFYSFASISYARCMLRCFSCLDPIIVYPAADIFPTFHILLPCFVCVSCLSLASHSACLGLLLCCRKISCDTLYILNCLAGKLQSGIGGQ